MTTEDTQERADLLETLITHRSFLRQTVSDLTDEQASKRATVSELCLGGLIKHVALVEKGWIDFIVQGPVAIGSADEAAGESHAAGFRMLEGETLARLLEQYLPAPSRCTLVQAGDSVVRPPGAIAHHRRDGPARRPRRHHPGVHRRRKNYGLTLGCRGAPGVHSTVP